MATKTTPLFSDNLYGIRTISISSRRIRSEVVRDILRLVQFNPSVKATLLAHLCSINYQKLLPILAQLLEHEFIGETRIGRTRRIYITTAGEEFLSMVASVCDVIGGEVS